MGPLTGTGLGAVFTGQRFANVGDGREWEWVLFMPIPPAMT